ncbi:MAG: GGDEF domain-containing protein [Lachnospiraceae bacterium]|nr:GGDEF domain-containing protein [Lachnospiraceae bacterium]
MKNKTIAVCMADIDEHYNDEFMSHFRCLAKKYQYHILCFYSFSSFYFMDSHDLGERNIFQLINYDMLDAIVVFPETFTDTGILDDIVTKAQEKDIFVVSVDSEVKGGVSVRFDDTIAIERIISHVLEEHHPENVNFISGPEEDECAKRRLLAFRKCMEEHGRAVEEERIGYGGFWHEPTRKVMKDFFESKLPFPEAIICANDAMAITVCEILREQGYKVPGDVIVTGYDGIPEAEHHTPPIVTAKRDIEASAKCVFSLLDQYFTGQSIDQCYYVEPKTVMKGTCGCAEEKDLHYNDLVRSLYFAEAGIRYFIMDQIRMSAVLAGANNFSEVFAGIQQYTSKLENQHFALCIVDDFMDEEEFSDIVENTMFNRTGYSSRMNRMLYRKYGQWQGMIDFQTKDLLPDLENVLEDCGSIIFFPVHIQERTIGYSAFSLDDDTKNMLWYYQFIMNVSNALDLVKSRHRQQMIIQNLENKYVHDPLTGLYNRRGFFQGIKPVFRQCIAEQREFKLLSIDLNGLKVINDTYGHADGDIAISTLGEALKSVGGEEDWCARFGGDEFVVAGAVTEELSGEALVKKIREYLCEFNAASGKPYQVDASIGLVTLVPDGNISVDEILKEADMRMYEEKVKHHKARK